MIRIVGGAITLSALAGVIYARDSLCPVIQKEISESLFLTAQSKLERTDHHAEIQNHAYCRNQLRLAVDKNRSIWSQSFVGRSYMDGYDAYVARDSTAALNAWTKYLEAAPRLAFKADGKQIKEVERFFFEWKTDWDRRQAVNWVQTVETPVPTLPPPTSLKRKVNQHRKKTIQFEAGQLTNKKASYRRLIQQAEQARQSGQMEQALRFYKLADNLNPGDSKMAVRIREMEKLIQ